MTPQKVVLFDIDYTLFNTDRFREIVYPAIAQKIAYSDIEAFYKLAKEIEYTLKQKQEHFSPNEFLEELSILLPKSISIGELKNIFADESVYVRSLHESVENVIESLRRHGVLVGILSTGDTAFQRQKIKHIEEHFADEDQHIFVNKIQELAGVLEKYREMKVYIVDDLPNVLAAAKKMQGDVTTIHVNRHKKHEESAIIDGFTPDHTISTIAQVNELVLEN